MKQFDLSIWLQDKSRKVVTRRGNPVRIICTDRKHGEDDLPIVFLEQCHNGEFLLGCRKDGRSDAYDTPYDLFFADEELTEFEKELNRIVIAFSDAHAYMDKNEIHHYSKGLLDLARKELKNNDWRQYLRSYKDVHEQGKRDVLKDLPKWKKSNDNLNLNTIVSHLNDDVLYWKGYYIWMKDLEKLPKEE